MFNFDQAIAQWRRQMLASGFENSTILDELESHLREEAERQMESGMTGQDAFDTAVGRIGQADALKQEFKKITGITEIGERIKNSVLRLAGIPNHCLDESMNTSHPNATLEPGWATYLKAALFVAPAVWLWHLALVGCVPQLKDVCERAGAIALPAFSRINIGISELITDHWIYLAVCVVFALGFLEWRTSKWPRYRRATIGLTTFILNCLLLVSLFLIICTGGVVAGMAIRAVK